MELGEELQQLLDGYVAAYRAGDAAGCAAVYTECGEIHSPFGPPAVGRAAIAAAHTAWFEEAEENKAITVLSVQGAGDLAACLARYSADIPREDGPPATEAGVTLSTFERQADGSWLIRMSALVPDANEAG